METGNIEAAPYKNVLFSLDLEAGQPDKKTGSEYRALYEKADKKKTAREKLQSDALDLQKRLAVEPKVLRSKSKSKSKSNIELGWVDQEERAMASNMISQLIKQNQQLERRIEESADRLRQVQNYCDERLRQAGVNIEKSVLQANIEATAVQAIPFTESIDISTPAEPQLGKDTSSDRIEK